MIGSQVRVKVVTEELFLQGKGKKRHDLDWG